MRTVADGIEIPARVIRVDDDDLVVLDPRSLIGGRRRIEPGASVEIHWRDRRGQAALRAVVEQSEATLAVRLFRERRATQRRAYVRTSTLLALGITTEAGAAGRGVGIDLSAVGLRARIAAPFSVGDDLRVSIDLPDGGDPVEVVARVVRRHAGSVAGLAFVDPPKAVSERLIRFVLASQQRASARRFAPPAPYGPGSFRRLHGGGPARP